jgi:hypothetical protein
MYLCIFQCMALLDFHFCLNVEFTVTQETNSYRYFAKKV